MIFFGFVALAILSIWMGFGVASASVLMGIGIAIDVTLATVGKFRDDDLSFSNWTFPIMLTHIGFPAFGYYGFWGLSQAYPSLNFILGMAGFILVALFLYEVFCEWINQEPIFGISETIGKIFGFKEDDARRIVAIMAVSWDALWSGPAKAAQTKYWNDLEVGISFIIAGLVVGIVAALALKLVLHMRRQNFNNVEDMARWSNVGKYSEFTVIGAFGILSLFHAFRLDAGLIISLAVAGAIMWLLFYVIFKDKLAESALEEAEEAIAGEDKDTDDNKVVRSTA